MSNPSSSPTLSTLNNVEKLLDELPKASFWGVMEICQWEGFWVERRVLQDAITFRSRFLARDDDVLLTSPMKTGSTWLKSISICIMQQSTPHDHFRKHYEDDILATESPHLHVPTVETIFHLNKAPQVDIYGASADPRLLHTHLPYTLLPDSVKNSACKIIYIARNPKDTLISLWHYLNSILGPYRDPFPLEKAVDCLCSGLHQYGSFFDHVLEYWQVSQKRPQKILFIRYEKLKSDPKGQVSKIAEFLGRPFRDEVEVDEILWKCSFERLKNLEVNKSGSISFLLRNSYYFRKGEVGDWKNYLTPEMEERIDQISRIKLEPFGLFL